MKELSKHIEVLLLKNDCVIIPGFGGFIAYSHPAVFDEQKQIICPPMRSLGFNPQLLINDGLLVQSYMEAYHTDFPDATRKIEETVYNLKEVLFNDGECRLPGIGTIYYNIRGVYEFKPEGAYFFTPVLYGLEEVSLLKPLSAQENLSASIDTTEEKDKIEEIATLDVPTIKVRKLHPIWQSVASVAAAVAFFLLLTTNLYNTQVDKYEYASLGTGSFMTAIQDQSVLYNSPSAPQMKQPKAVRTVKVAPAKKKQQPVITEQPTEKKVSEKTVEKITSVPVEKTKDQAVPVTKKHYVIVASLTQRATAEKEKERLQSLGYKRVEILSTEKIHRVSIGAYDTAADAYNYANELRQSNGMKDLWVFVQ